jgi:hypothetical protein
MKKDGATATLDARLLIVAGLHHNIVEMIGAFEIFVGGGIGQVYLAVIISVAYGFAPAPAPPDR